MIINNRKPEIVVFAGPNGSGKSTLYELIKPTMEYVNADEIKKSLKCSDIDAAKEAEAQREEYLVQKKDFCFETVMSTERNLKLLQRAKEVGYFIRCFYALTSDPSINILRVATRVEEGGHNVPTNKIVDRYNRSLKIVKDVVAVSDICHIYDNSYDEFYRIFKKRKELYFYDAIPIWTRDEIIRLTGINDMTEMDLNI